MKNLSFTFALFAIAALGTARAELLTLSSYNVTLADSMPDVTRIMMMEEYDDGGVGATWAFSAAGGSTTFLQNPFVHSTPVVNSLLIGMTQDLPLDPPGQKHIVLFMDSNTAASAEHIAWGTLFLNTNEDQLIAALELATSGLSFEEIGPGLDAIFTFAGGDAKTIPGSLGPVSAWFTMGSSFAVMAFSEGTVLGSGESLSALTPEPGTSVLVFTALAIVALKIRRRRAS